MTHEPSPYRLPTDKEIQDELKNGFIPSDIKTENKPIFAHNSIMVRRVAERTSWFCNGFVIWSLLIDVLSDNKIIEHCGKLTNPEKLWRFVRNTIIENKLTTNSFILAKQDPYSSAASFMKRKLLNTED